MRDARPISIPAFMGPLPIKTDRIADEHRESVKPLLKKIFGANPSISARYEIQGGMVALLAGRGQILKNGVGDAGQADKSQRTQYGDVTCSYMMIKKHVFPTIVVCWFATPRFGASLLVIGSGLGEMEQIAGALDAAIPLMRDGAA